MNQLHRFVRLFVMASLPAIATLTSGASKLTVAAAIAVVLPALEVAWRKLYPTVPAPPPAQLPIGKRLGP